MLDLVILSVDGVDGIDNAPDRDAHLISSEATREVALVRLDPLTAVSSSTR